MPTPDELRQKYAIKSPEEMEKEQEELEKEYTLRSVELEQKIFGTVNKTDEMKIDNEVVAIVKRPTKSQMNRMLPPELAKYREKPESIPYEVAKKYEGELYKLMEELIVSPKHEAVWWTDHVGDEFVEAFQMHLASIQSKIQEDTANFLQRKSGTPS